MEKSEDKNIQPTENIYRLDFINYNSDLTRAGHKETLKIYLKKTFGIVLNNKFILNSIVEYIFNYTDITYNDQILEENLEALVLISLPVSNIDNVLEVLLKCMSLKEIYELVLNINKNEIPETEIIDYLTYNKLIKVILRERYKLDYYLYLMKNIQSDDLKEFTNYQDDYYPGDNDEYYNENDDI